jgi:spore germination cell wall hydrolase CwlJ-like protein
MGDSISLPGAARLRFWQAAATLIVLIALALVGASAHGSYAIPETGGNAARGSVSVAVPPAPPPLVVRQVDPQDALRINSEIPLASGPNPAAAPFSMANASATTRDRALECLTQAVYYEAGSESADGQRAVAQVVLNRVRHPAFPASVCRVVYQGSTQPPGCQFTFTCDGSLNRAPDRAHWEQARRIAEAALNGAVFAPVGMATNYHANYVVPVWAPTLLKNAVVGVHYFYRLKGRWGTPAAFTENYAGSEPDASSLKRAALAAFASFETIAGNQNGGAQAGKDGTLAQQLTAVDLKLSIAAQTLGAKNPQLAELEKQHATLARKVPQAASVQLAAVEAEIKDASRTLGPKHPQMIALEQRRAELLRKTGRD